MWRGVLTGRSAQLSVVGSKSLIKYGFGSASCCELHKYGKYGAIEEQTVEELIARGEAQAVQFSG